MGRFTSNVFVVVCRGAISNHQMNATYYCRLMNQEKSMRNASMSAKSPIASVRANPRIA